MSGEYTGPQRPPVVLPTTLAGGPSSTKGGGGLIPRKAIQVGWKDTRATREKRRKAMGNRFTNVVLAVGAALLIGSAPAALAQPANCGDINNDGLITAA